MYTYVALLRSWVHLILMLFRTFSPRLDDNDTFQYSSDSFQNLPYISGCVQNCQNYISMYCCSPITPGAPKSQQETKTYLKLLLILADSGWIWLILTDSGWLLMTLADSSWLWLSARGHLSQPESARVRQSQPVSAVVGQSWHWLTLADSGWLWLALANSNRLWRTARVIQSQQDLSKVIPSWSESASFNQILPESARVLDRFWALLAFWGP